MENYYVIEGDHVDPNDIKSIKEENFFSIWTLQ